MWVRLAVTVMKGERRRRKGQAGDDRRYTAVADQGSQDTRDGFGPVGEGGWGGGGGGGRPGRGDGGGVGGGGGLKPKAGLICPVKPRPRQD